jgi:hypothetical protein
MLECRGGRRGDDGRLHIEAAMVLCVRQRRYRSSKAEGFDLQDYGGSAVGWSGRDEEEEEEEETAGGEGRAAALSLKIRTSRRLHFGKASVKAAKRKSPFKFQTESATCYRILGIPVITFLLSMEALQPCIAGDTQLPAFLLFKLG